ncbi:S-layer homology domain-containing protein [Dysosmobacter sp.]|uniref:S-layer homology domain-containing protein n=1 Tax=Dysosmobacter sp. TaxID=2591382 RepID=UPI003AF6F97C
MKKRILSCLMALALCLTLLPATAQAAEEDTHTHCLCGKSGCTEADRVEIAFSKWLTSDREQTSNSWRLDCGNVGDTTGNRVDSENGNGNWVLEDGRYYLRTGVENYTKYSEVKIDRTIVIRGDVTICLNGQTLESSAKDQPVFLVEADSTLTLTDCKGNMGKVKHTSDGSGSGVKVESGGTFNMYGGTISGNTATNGGGVGVYGTGSAFATNGSAFIMNGGAISGNTATNNGGVYVSKSGTFEMHNSASVTGNTASDNTADQGNGGGVYVYSGTFEMNDTASVSGNTATNSKSENTTYGGGVYVSSNGTFNMNGEATSVSNNKATNGGGVYVSKSGTFNMNGNASIKSNTGNGVCVGERATFTVSSAPTVTGNTVKNTVGNAASNVYLNGGAYITIGKNGLTDGASIGVTKKKGVDNGVIAKNVSTDYSGKFFSDDKTREVKYKDNQLVLAEKDTSAETHTHCLCGKTHTAIGDHQTEQEVTFATELKMENGKLMKGGREWIKSMVNRADGGREQRGYVLSQGEYYLYGDITLSDAAILINGDVKLCLNGHTIDRANKTGGIDYVIWVLGNDKAHLTLTDCVGGGTIKGGGNGGVDIFGFCTLDMFGGTITGNTNRGVGVGQFGEFNMYGGKITGNSAGFGGGVYNGGTVNMYGGEVSDNTASNKGGGVYMEASVGNYQGGILNVSGAAKITDNTVKGVANNVYLPSGKTIAIGTGSLSGTIGVTTEPKPAAGKPVKVIADTKGNAGLTTHVVSDDNAYETAVQGSTIVLQVVGDGGTTPAGKPAPKYTPPTAKTGLVYNGTAQVLISESHVEGGMMQYRLDNGAYSPDLPTATNAGIYTVYYKVVGDASHNDVAEKSLKVTIAKASLSGTPAYTLITSIGKTLADANLTAGDIKPENGQIKWVDENGVELAVSTEVKANTAYRWKFTPDDTSNYEELTGSITLYPASTDGGGSSGGGGGSSSDRDSSDSNPIIKTETKNNPDGSTTKTETRRDGSVTQTTTGKDGGTSKTETKPNGSSVTENKAADGSTGTVKTDKNGQTTAETKVSAKAVEDAKRNGEAVKAPVEVKASRDSSTAPVVKVELPRNSGETKVEIPVSNVKSGTVAVLVHPDGTEEILKNSIPTEDGIQLTVDGNATVKIVDNSKGFIDTRNHWAEDAIDFVSARGLVNGMSDTIYAPNNSTTRAQLWTILARQNDADLTGGSVWYEKAQNWAKDKGVSDGANPNAAINRAQMVTMLWRAVGQPAPATAATFTDVSADAYYADAVSWAVENGITTGIGNGRFDPTGACTRAQIAAFLTRLYAEK